MLRLTLITLVTFFASIVFASTQCQVIELTEQLTESNLKVRCDNKAMGYIQNELHVDSVKLLVTLKDKTQQSIDIQKPQLKLIDFAFQAQSEKEVEEQIKKAGIKVEDIQQVDVKEFSVSKLPTLTKHLVFAHGDRSVASASRRFSVSGPITSFDDRTVTIRGKDSLEVQVPRKSIPRYYKIRPGFEVTAYIDHDPSTIKKAKN